MTDSPGYVILLEARDGIYLGGESGRVQGRLKPLKAKKSPSLDIAGFRFWKPALPRHSSEPVCNGRRKKLCFIINPGGRSILLDQAQWLALIINIGIEDGKKRD